MLPELKMNNPVSSDYQTQYDSEGRFRVPFFNDKPACPLKANSADEDAWIESMMPSDEGAGMRKVVPDPFKEAADLALAEALVSDLSEQVHRLATGADETERKELEALGMISDEELSVILRRR